MPLTLPAGCKFWLRERNCDQKTGISPCVSFRFGPTLPSVRNQIPSRIAALVRRLQLAASAAPNGVIAFPTKSGLLFRKRAFMDIRGLRYFATVAELGSFTKAAARINVAQPALSRQVKQLEDRLGLELLSRQGRSVRLTEAGEALLRHALTIQRDFERLVEDMQARKTTPAGRVVFGVSPALAHIVVPAVLSRLADEFPAITLHVAEGVSSVLAQWLQDNQIDLGILGLIADFKEAKARGLRLEVLTSEDMVIAERTGNRRAPPIYSRAMLEAKPLILSKHFESVIRHCLEPPEVNLNVPLIVDSMLALKALVMEGQAATILPVSMLREQLRDGTVTASAITELGVRRDLTLAWPNFRQSTRATEAVAKIIRMEVERRRQQGMFSWLPPKAQRQRCPATAKRVPA